jgi:hypothetical protein
MAIKPWALPSVVANTVTDLVVPGANLEAALFGLILCNTSTVDSADVTVTLTTSTGTIKATLLKASLGPGEAIHIDTKIFIAASTTPDKLRVLSTLPTVSFLASGEEG